MEREDPAPADVESFRGRAGVRCPAQRGSHLQIKTRQFLGNQVLEEVCERQRKSAAP